MAYKFQKGTAVLSGALDQEGSIDIIDDGSGELELKHAGTTVIDSSRNLCCCWYIYRRCLQFERRSLFSA